MAAWQEGIVKKKETGKDELTVADMAAVSGMDAKYIKKCLKHEFLQKPHFTSKFAIDGVHLTNEQQERVDKHIQATKSQRGPGFAPEKNIHEMAVNKTIEEAKREGRPIAYKWREISAEETFQKFWESPAGQERMTKKLKREVENIDRGGEWSDDPAGLHSMPQGYDRVFWNTTQEKAAKLWVDAKTGDEEAMEKYKELYAEFSEFLPQPPEAKSEKRGKRGAQ